MCEIREHSVGIIKNTFFTLAHAPMDNTSLCKLIREALDSPEKAEALALAINHLLEVKQYCNCSW